jgi:hypothetical protein
MAARFDFSLMVPDVVDGIACRVAQDEGVRRAIEQAVAEAVAAHQEAAACIDGLEAIYNAEAGASRTMPVSPAHSPDGPSRQRRA